MDLLSCFREYKIDVCTILYKYYKMGISIDARGPVKRHNIPEKYRNAIQVIISEYGDETEIRNNELYYEFYSKVVPEMKVVYVNWTHKTMVCETSSTVFETLDCSYSRYYEFCEFLEELSTKYKPEVDINLVNLGGCEGFIYSDWCVKYLEFMNSIKGYFNEDDINYEDDYESEMEMWKKIKYNTAMFYRLYDLVKIGANEGYIMVS